MYSTAHFVDATPFIFCSLFFKAHNIFYIPLILSNTVKSMGHINVFPHANITNMRAFPCPIFSSYPKRENNCPLPPSWKKNMFLTRGGGRLFARQFSNKKNKKSEEKNFFQKNASKAVKNLYTKSDCKKVFGLKMTKMAKKFLN